MGRGNFSRGGRWWHRGETSNGTCNRPGEQQTGLGRGRPITSAGAKPSRDISATTPQKLGMDHIDRTSNRVERRGELRGRFPGQTNQIGNLKNNWTSSQFFGKPHAHARPHHHVDRRRRRARHAIYSFHGAAAWNSSHTVFRGSLEGQGDGGDPS